MRLRVTAPGYWEGTAAGSSICVSGVCLTLTECTADEGSFDVVSETLRKTTLGELRPGAGVNLEKSVPIGGRLDGHFVQGHVEGTATVARVEESSAGATWWFAAPRALMPCIVPKGAIAVDGISLTIAEVKDDSFAVALIPTTLTRTTIGGKGPGARVNIETDILARTVVHYLQSVAGARRPSGGLTIDQLREQGFA